ncbi:hypothetical protein CVU76_02835 [Candidatus Dojkabacteria bacterium HGW-Dojkabacteria-1]|uniref:YibE/F family protein n=1 Tax=Candidatus Dojkabacteria bacterium HGW-Dojkabacteria-1 TaxID=2013761 RepID=A0A2N2F459_9BACT|nr:MAG: hypothetical protein CVU76_02835 [Candidatus Dojkabacteria bacterium HGW-Dojkabacteria-1]
MKITTILFTLFLFLFPLNIYAQETEETFKGVVEEVFNVPCSDVLDDGYTCFEYLIRIDETDESVRTSIPILSEDGKSKFNIGDRVYTTYMTDGFDYESWAITGFVREGAILIMVVIFALAAIIIGKRQGFGSLLSLAFTVMILYGWAIPRILDGGDVLLIGVVTVSITLVMIMYVSHGFNRKSSIAVLSTLIGVVIVALLAKLFISMVRVDGSGSEEAFLLLSQTGGSIDLAAVFFISILIGAVGVLDDVVMSQVSSIQELHLANPTLSSRKLFSQAMNIGKDHLSSMVNTLFIAYAGSSFALVILLTYNSGGIGNILRTDAIAEEIVRTLAASTGILLIVPITSFIASYLIPRGKLNTK